MVPRQIGRGTQDVSERVRRFERRQDALELRASLECFERFGESSMDFMLGIWTVQGNYLAIKNSIQEEIKRRFDAEGIEIPFPHRTIHVGSASETFPVELPDGARRGSLDEPV